MSSLNSMVADMQWLAMYKKWVKSRLTGWRIKLIYIIFNGLFVAVVESIVSINETG